MWQRDTQYVAQTQHLKRAYEKWTSYGKKASNLISSIDNERILHDRLLAKLLGGLDKEVWLKEV